MAYIDNETEKIKFIVDGKPFFYNGIQFSLTRLMDRDGWNWPDMEIIFQKAAENHFTVIAMPLMWNHIEPKKDCHIWTDVERSLDIAAKYGLKLEYLWFGSQICSLSSLSEGTPCYVLNEYQKVVDPDGNPIFIECIDHITNQYEKSFKLDITDHHLLEREKYILGLAMEYVGAYSRSKEYHDVLVGVEVLNEPTAVVMWNRKAELPRSYSSYADRLWYTGGYTDIVKFRADILWDYLNGLASAVKKSICHVWTRVNFYEDLEGMEQLRKLIEKNEEKRSSGESFLDFIGKDTYSEDPEYIFKYCTESIYKTGKNLVMIMENGGNYENSDQLIFNALAGDGVYHIWELCDTIQDKPAGLYYTDNDKNLHPYSHQIKIRKMNQMLIKNWYDLASKRNDGISMTFINREFTPDNEVAESLGCYKIYYKAFEPGGGIISLQEKSLIFLSSCNAQFRIAPLSNVQVIEKGFFNKDNEWICQGKIPYCQIDNHVCFNIDTYECYRVLLIV